MRPYAGWRGQRIGGNREVRVARSGNFSEERLARLSTALRGHVERGEVAGIVALLHRRGETHVETIGVLDRESGAPMRRDSIFHIASMTKLMTAATALGLVEEGIVRLDAPVDRWLPELADRRVLRAIDSPLDDTVSADRPITLRDLLTLRPGVGAIMDGADRYPIGRALEEAQVAPGPGTPTIAHDEFVRRLGALPLIYQPGERWMYHTAYDILSVLLARVGGKPLEEVMRERLFGPLGMRDSSYRADAARRGRRATIYGAGADGALAPYPEQPADPPIFASEIFSTADDCLAFGRMLLGLGRHDGGRLLARPTVELMMTDQITPEQKALSPFFPGFWEGRGWGFGGAMVSRRDGIAASPGRFGWDGGFGTSLYVDPREELVGVLLVQRPFDPVVFGLHDDFWTLAYAALAD